MRECAVYRHAFAHARGSSCTSPRTSVSLTEDTVSVDANASQLGSRPKALSEIEFHQTSFNQQVFKVRITFPLLRLAGQGESRHRRGLSSVNGMAGWHRPYSMPLCPNTLRHKYTTVQKTATHFGVCQIKNIIPELKGYFTFKWLDCVHATHTGKHIYSLCWWQTEAHRHKGSASARSHSILSITILLTVIRRFCLELIKCRTLQTTEILDTKKQSMYKRKQNNDRTQVKDSRERYKKQTITNFVTLATSFLNASLYKANVEKRMFENPNQK